MKSLPIRLLGLAMITLGWLTSTACIANAPQSYFFPPSNNEVGQTVSKSLDSNGGTVQVANGAAAVSIPGGALGGTTAVTVTVKDRALSPNAAQLSSQVFDFGPDGTQFLQPVSIALQASDPPATGLRAVLAFLNAQGSWQVVPNSSYNAVSQTVTGSVTHFTNFAVFLIDAQGSGCTSSPDPNAFCSPSICDTAHSLCGAAKPQQSFRVGGTLSGLSTGTVTLFDNGADALSLTANGNFTFATALNDRSAYAVSVAQQPNAQLCTVAQGSGTIAGTNVNQVTISCAPTYAIGGGVSGLNDGEAVVLQNGNDRVTVTSTNPYFVLDRAPSGAAYAVTIATMPPGQSCELSGASGTVGRSDVGTVRVLCTTLSYPLGGHVQGLVSAAQVNLTNGNDSIVVGNGNFTFPTPVLYGGNFTAALTAPPGESCTFVGANIGTGGPAGATQIAVMCTPNNFTLGGRVSGLVGQSQVTLTRGADVLAIGNGTYTLPTSVPYGANYQLIVTSAAGQSCQFSDGNTFLSATMPGANVTNANLVCVPATYGVGGTVTGLVGQGNVVLQNGADSISVYNGTYAFPTQVTYGAGYSASLTAPAGQSCVFSPANGNVGTMPAASVRNISVSCSPTAYSLGGAVTGLMYNANAILQNGADTLTVSDGNYTFPTSVPFNSGYNVTVTSPNGQVCTFTPDSASSTGVMPAAAIGNINLNCILLPSSIFINAPQSVVTAVPFSVTLSILDAMGNVLTGYMGTVALTSSDAQGNPNDTGQAVVFDSNSQGMVTIPGAQLTSVGTQMLFANDAANQVQGQVSITVTSMFRTDARGHACGHFSSGVEFGEAALLDANPSAVSGRNVAQWPAFSVPSLKVADGRGVSGTHKVIEMRGVGTGVAPTFAALDAFDVTAWDITLDAASYVSYWVFPVAYESDEVDAKGEAGDSAYAALKVIFDDGTDTFTTPVVDTRGHLVVPTAQGKRLTPNTWNHVQVPLGAFAGKRVQGLAFGWQHDGAEGLFHVRFDTIDLVGADACHR